MAAASQEMTMKLTAGHIRERFMSRCLTLAAKGYGGVHPNPMVGCVIVKNGRVIAEGFHSRFGGPHAEIVALRKAGRRARGATLYVNLEPCCHLGKTPACSDAIIAAGIKAVHVAIRDPNPLVAGKGVRALRQSGIRVEEGLLSRQAERLNDKFLF